MSVYGDWVAATIASGAAESAAIDLGRDYDYLSIQIPEMNGGNIYLKVAETTGGTYYTLGGDGISLYEMTAFKKSPVGEDETEDDAKEDYESFNRADSIRLGGWRFIKVCADELQGAERLIRVRGMRY
jgi:hypothetical protein